ncbi:MAG: YlxR family protein [Clostridiales bacterium]|nr:YlxR family protein [Clostridiales bacterium]MDY4894712.1 YlxR family protein [Christensenellaceae bacterium]
MGKIEPKRMCVACREMKEKREMFRVVKNAAGEIFADFSGKAAGRGAYICNNDECMKRLKKQRLLNKAFSAPVSDEVYRRIEEEVQSQNAKR